MAADTKTTPKNSVAEIFKSMEYGPAPEADNVVKAWLNDHDNGEFGLFIDGKWVKPDGRKTYQTKNPATGEPLATTIQGEQEDVDLAVSSAKKAYETWSKTPNHVRARHLYSIARHIQKHMRLFSVVEAMDNGKTFRETRDADIPIVVRHFYHHAGWAQLMDTEMRGWKSVGVIGGIVPWNFPLMLLTWKIAPALAMGNTVVLKPATYTRLSALLLAEVCAEAGLPPGVFNVITGSGAMGSKLADHPDVDKVAFTGSTGVGQTLRRLTAGSGKKLSLELGGKSPVVVFETADLDSTVEGVVDAIWFNQGQVCSAGSRLLVQEGIHDKLVAKLKERLTHFRVGDSLDKTVDMGAIVDESQRKSIEEYVESARQEGAEIFQISPIPKKGCFYPPTIITNVQTVSRVVVEEIFGPVLVVLPFRTAKEAIALSNNTIYGLGGSVWTENIPLALEAALSIKAGTLALVATSRVAMVEMVAKRDYLSMSDHPGKRGRDQNLCSWILKAFGQMVQARPTIGNNQKNEISADGNLPGIDRTFKMYYGGKQARPDAPYARPVVSPNGTVIAHVGEGNRKDVRNAVEAAHAAAAGWGKRAAHNRAQIVYYMAENLELRRDEVANRIHQMTGRSMDDCRTEVDLSVQRLFHWGAYCDKYGGTVQETTLYGCTVKVHEPMGVIGIACPDEYPLLGFVSLFAPAVIRGNVIVIVPSEKYPLSALDLYQVFDTSDLPGGVVNILTGDRNHLAKYLTEHQDVQSMWYFGTAEGSKFVEYMSAENVKRTWVNYGLARDWTDQEQGQGEEFLYQSIQWRDVFGTKAHHTGHACFFVEVRHIGNDVDIILLGFSIDVEYR
ncbi:ALDH [Mytilus coruscus]|uniref:ALDH n=1 Tax=Mytilus coruscus TaxID=42192 RepID=A0A6J7ZZR8_MYTCO|nr:ALDH [Mytilus coruscus]